MPLHYLFFWRKSRKPLPALEVATEVAFLQGSFVFPNPWMRAVGTLPGSSTQVCSVSYGVSPLLDRVYVDELKVHEDYQRQGLARALLLQVAERASPPGRTLPVTPLCELWTSSDFWAALRAGAVPGLIVTRDVRAGDMAEEQRRWRSR